MSGRAWAASLVLHSGIVVLLVGFAGADPSLRRPERWEVKMAFSAPPEPPTVPALPSPLSAFEPVATPPPFVQASFPPPVVTNTSPASKPTVSTSRPRLPPVAAVKPLPKRGPLPKPPRPVSEKPASVPRKPAPSPPAVAAKAAPRSSKQPGLSPFLDAPTQPTRQKFSAASRSAFKGTREAPPGNRADASNAADRSTARDHAPSAKAISESGTANWNAALRAKLRELRVYPPVARRLGQEGVVTLLLEIGANGDVRGLAVRQSSGHAVLDQAAQQLARNAVAALRGELSPPGESRLEVPVAYRLER
ncbi:MAG: TonB family protein [Candidatus Competibacter sp.]